MAALTRRQLLGAGVAGVVTPTRRRRPLRPSRFSQQYTLVLPSQSFQEYRTADDRQQSYASMPLQSIALTPQRPAGGFLFGPEDRFVVSHVDVFVRLTWQLNDGAIAPPPPVSVIADVETVDQRLFYDQLPAQYIALQVQGATFGDGTWRTVHELVNPIEIDPTERVFLSMTMTGPCPVAGGTGSAWTAGVIVQGTYPFDPFPGPKGPTAITLLGELLDSEGRRSGGGEPVA